MDNRKISYDVIIGHYSSDEYRHRNLIYVINYYLKQTPDTTNIIITEQFTDTPIYQYIESVQSNRIIYKKIDSNQPAYSRSIGFNEGVRLSNKDTWLLVDNDCIVSPIILNNIEQFYMGNALIPYNDCIDLDNEQTLFTIENNNINGGTSRGGENACRGGSLFINRLTFNRVGGYDPGFIGWGGEDDALFCKLYVLSKVYRPRIDRVIPMFHMWHPRSVDMNWINGEIYQNNLALLNYIKKMSASEMTNYVNSITSNQLSKT